MIGCECRKVWQSIDFPVIKLTYEAEQISGKPNERLLASR